MSGHSIPLLSAIWVTLLLLGVLLYLLIKWMSFDVDAKLTKEIELLLASIGKVTPPIDPTQLEKLHHQGDFPRMLGWIKNSMRLDLRVGLRIVDVGKDKAPMWIETPRVMAPFGTEAFRQTRVVVNVRTDVLKQYPFEWIVAGFAHELAHVVLFAIGHSLQHSERAVDLTAMIAGYRNFVIRTDRLQINGGALAVVLAIFGPFVGIFFAPGHTKSSLGYLTKGEKRAACRYLEKVERRSGLSR